MPVPKARALRLASAAEQSLVASSFGRAPAELSDARLKQKVARARTQRNKYRDLAKRQRLEARGKRDAQRRRPARGNENTVLKATLFDEALARFQAEQERRKGGTGRSTPSERKPAKQRKSAVRGRAAGTSRPSAAGSGKGGVKRASLGAANSSARSRSDASKGKRKQSAFARGGKVKARAHAGARTRRRQARRDSR